MLVTCYLLSSGNEEKVDVFLGEVVMYRCATIKREARARSIFESRHSVPARCSQKQNRRPFELTHAKLAAVTVTGWPSQ